MKETINKSVEILIVYVLSVYILKTIALEVCNDQHCLYTDGSPQNLTFEDARNFCKQNSSWLLEIYDENITDLVDNLSANMSDKILEYGILVGMKREPGGWQWINNHTFNGTADLINENLMLATLGKSSGVLKYLGSSFGIYEHVICNKTVTSPDACPGWIYKNMCYFAIRHGVTWYEAHNLCIQNRSSMATFEDISLNELSTFPIWNDDRARYWIGLSRHTWKWMNRDEYVTYNKWIGYDIWNNYTQIKNNSWITERELRNVIVVCMSEFRKNEDHKITYMGKLNPNTITFGPGDFSSGAKVGIGVGIGVFVTIFIVSVAGLLIKFIKPKRALAATNTSQTTVQGTRDSEYESNFKNMSEIEHEYEELAKK